MKKVLVTILVAGSLITGAASSFAATSAKPSVKPVTGTTTAKEGTAKHEMSETSTTQSNEAKSTKKTTVKPMTTKKAKTTKSAKPMATKKATK